MAVSAPKGGGSVTAHPSASPGTGEGTLQSHSVCIDPAQSGGLIIPQYLGHESLRCWKLKVI